MISKVRTSHFDLFYQMNIPNETSERFNWDEYFLMIAAMVSMRSTCIRRKYGSVIVKDYRIISTGYNNPPTGAPHCIDTGCMREQLNIPQGERYDLCRAIHSEMNAIKNAEIEKIDIKDTTLYLVGYDCTKNSFIQGIPCKLCMPLCIKAGLKDWVTCSNGISGEILRRKFELVQPA